MKKDFSSFVAVAFARAGRFILALCPAALLLSTLLTGAASASPVAGHVIEVTPATLVRQIQEARAARLPVLIEYYIPDEDNCERCPEQQAAFEQVSELFAGRVVFLRFNVLQQPGLMEWGGINVFPTHLFVVHYPAEEDFVALRVRGYLSAEQLQEVIHEVFQLVP